ncbi:MAG: Helix-turn-helix domain [Bacillota bacterium]|nr:Helix-turn-helix domain [Bacillota bacterium]
MSEITRVTMTAKEASKYLGMGYSKILGLSAAGEIPHIKLGKTYYFTKEFLDRWLEEQQTKPSKEQEIVNDMQKKYPHLTTK